RLPLAELTVVVPNVDRFTAAFTDILADELNLKHIKLVDEADTSAEDFGISQQLTVNARAAGPRLGKDVQTVIKASKSGDWSMADLCIITAAGIVLRTPDYTLLTVVSKYP